MRIQSDGDTPPSAGEPLPQKHRLQTNPTFPAVNPPATAPGADDPNDVHAHLRSATADPGPRAAGIARSNAENDTLAIARGREGAQPASINSDSSLGSAPRRSRRTRDFFIVLLGGNAVIAALMAVASINPVSLIFGFAGMVVFTTGLTWVVFGIMDRY